MEVRYTVYAVEFTNHMSSSTYHADFRVTIGTGSAQADEYVFGGQFETKPLALESANAALAAFVAELRAGVEGRGDTLREVPNPAPGQLV